MFTDVLKFPLPSYGQATSEGTGRESYAAGAVPANDVLVQQLAELLGAGVALLGATAGAVYVRLDSGRQHLVASVGLADEELRRRRRHGPASAALNGAIAADALVVPIETAGTRTWGLIELVLPADHLLPAEQRRAWEAVVRHAGWTVDRHRRAVLWEELAGDEGDTGLPDADIRDGEGAGAAGGAGGAQGWQTELPLDAAAGAVPAFDRERQRTVARDGLAADRRRPQNRTVQLERAAASLARATRVRDVARELVRQVSARLRVSGVLVAQRAPGGDELVPLAARGSVDTLLGGGQAVPMSAPLTLAEAARAGRAVLHDVDGHGRTREVALPLRTADGVPAVLGVLLADGRDLGAEDRELLRALARVGGQALERARLHEAANAASQAKSDFLAMMSHELRTPLNAIIGYSGLIAEQVVGPVNATQHEQLRRVQEHARHLLTLIEEMLTISQAATGRERVREERVDPGALLRDVVALLAPAAARKGLAVHVVVAEGLQPVVTDADKVRQVLAHLLTNAIKFTESGEVEARVHEQRAGDQRLLCVEVRDTGVGIAAQHLERIFEPFWQADQSRAHRVAGTGLGLNVTRRLAYLLGGEVTVTSEPGRGSTFVLRVPVR